VFNGLREKGGKMASWKGWQESVKGGNHLSLGVEETGLGKRKKTDGKPAFQIEWKEKRVPGPNLSRRGGGWPIEGASVKMDSFTKTQEDIMGGGNGHPRQKNSQETRSRLDTIYRTTHSPGSGVHWEREEGI